MNKKLNLDFSGGPESWFAFWHLHIDWVGEGNKGWKTRKIFLEQLLQAFYELREKLVDYPRDFQLWIMIDENDSTNDSVYIHTKNPNSDNFPLKVKADNENTINDKNLKVFVDSLGFEKVKVETSDGYIYYLFDKNFGVSLWD
jgi:hypothetical protein